MSKGQPKPAVTRVVLWVAGIAVVAFLVFVGVRLHQYSEYTSAVQAQEEAAPAAAVARVDSLGPARGSEEFRKLSDRDIEVAVRLVREGEWPVHVASLLQREVSRRESIHTVAALEHRVRRIAALAKKNHAADDPKARREKIREAIEAHPDWSDQVLADVVCGVVRLGMTKDQVRAARGGPDRVRRTGTSEGLTELWVYDDWLDTYLYFHDGVLVAWED